MKKMVGICAVLMIVPFILSGCLLKSKVINNEEELVFVITENTSESVQYKINTLQKHAQRFEQENPGVTITFEKVLKTVNNNDLRNRLHNKKQTDLVFAAYTPEFVQGGIYADLLPFYKVEQKTTDDLYKALLEMTTYKGQFIGIPMAPQPMAVYYNKTWFEKAGLVLPREGWTWDDYFDISAKLVPANEVQGKKIYGSLVPMELTFFETLAQSSGHSILSPDGARVEGFLNSKPVSEAIFKVLHHIHHSQSTKPISNSLNSTYLELSANQAGMGIGQYVVYSFLEKHPNTKGKIGVTSLPRMENGVHVNSVNMEMLSIASASKNKKLAWKFIRDIILNPDSPFQEDWSRQEMLTTKSAVQKVGQLQRIEIKLFIDELEYAIQPVVYKNQLLSEMTVEGITAKLNEAKTLTEVQEALTEAAMQIDAKLKKGK